MSEPPCGYTHIGGQALVEGVMMRGKNSWALSVRDARGVLHTEDFPLPSADTAPAWQKWPLLRGVVSLGSSLALGMRALTLSATLASIGADDAEAEEPDEAATVAASAGESSPRTSSEADAEGLRGCGVSPADAATVATSSAGAKAPGTEVSEGVGGAQATEGQAPGTDVSEGAEGVARVRERAPSTPSQAVTPQTETPLSKGAIIGAVMVALVMAVLLFIVAPAALTNLIVGPADVHVFYWNLVDGLLRVAAFFGYVLLIGRLPDIHRVFAYHGAEHKTIHCLEHGEELSPENARRYSTQHLRCGTAFLLMVLVIAILIYTLIPIRLIALQLGITNSWLLLLVVVAIRLLLLPLIAGISYEITVKWAGQHEDNFLVRAIMWPGLQMQRLTTAEPTDDMLEAAIAATRAVQAAEAGE